MRVCVHILIHTHARVYLVEISELVRVSPVYIFVQFSIFLRPSRGPLGRRKITVYEWPWIILCAGRGGKISGHCLQQCFSLISKLKDECFQGRPYCRMWTKATEFQCNQIYNPFSYFITTFHLWFVCFAIKKGMYTFRTVLFTSQGHNVKPGFCFVLFIVISEVKTMGCLYLLHFNKFHCLHFIVYIYKNRSRKTVSKLPSLLLFSYSIFARMFFFAKIIFARTHWMQKGCWSVIARGWVDTRVTIRLGSATTRWLGAPAGGLADILTSRMCRCARVCDWKRWPPRKRTVVMLTSLRGAEPVVVRPRTRNSDRANVPEADEQLQLRWTRAAPRERPSAAPKTIHLRTFLATVRPRDGDHARIPAFDRQHQPIVDFWVSSRTGRCCASDRPNIKSQTETERDGESRPCYVLRDGFFGGSEKLFELSFSQIEVVEKAPLSGEDLPVEGRRRGRSAPPTPSSPKKISVPEKWNGFDSSRVPWQLRPCACQTTRFPLLFHTTIKVKVCLFYFCFLFN